MAVTLKTAEVTSSTKSAMVEGFISHEQDEGRVPPYRYPPDGGLRKLKRIHSFRPSFTGTHEGPKEPLTSKPEP